MSEPSYTCQYCLSGRSWRCKDRTCANWGGRNMPTMRSKPKQGRRGLEKLASPDVFDGEAFDGRLRTRSDH